MAEPGRNQARDRLADGSRIVGAEQQLHGAGDAARIPAEVGTVPVKYRAALGDELEARVLLLEQKIAQLENRLKAAESGMQQDDVLSQVMVKPEDTAGVPAGWGKK